MFAYLIKYRHDTDETKEKRFAVVIAGGEQEARDKINDYNVNTEKKSCIYIYSVRLMNDGEIVDGFDDEMCYEDWMNE